MLSLQATTADDAVAGMRSHGILQPCLFRLRNDRGCNYYIKADNTSIPLPGASCFTEAVQQLVMAFWVFHVKYPDNLRNFYQFLEHVIGIGQQTLSPIVRDFLREISAIQWMEEISKEITHDWWLTDSIVLQIVNLIDCSLQRSCILQFLTGWTVSDIFVCCFSSKSHEQYCFAAFVTTAMPLPFANVMIALLAAWAKSIVA